MVDLSCDSTGEGAFLSNKARVHITGTAGVLSEQQSRALLGQPCLVQREGRLLLGLQLLHLCLHLHSTASSVLTVAHTMIIIVVTGYSTCIEQRWFCQANAHACRGPCWVNNPESGQNSAQPGDGARFADEVDQASMFLSMQSARSSCLSMH